MLLVAARLSSRNVLCALQRLPGKVSCSLLLLGCIHCPYYKDSKLVMSCYLTEKEWKDESDPKSLSCGLFAAVLYLQCA